MNSNLHGRRACHFCLVDGELLAFNKIYDEQPKVGNEFLGMENKKLTFIAMSDPMYGFAVLRVFYRPWAMVCTARIDGPLAPAQVRALPSNNGGF